jgi:6-phosphofructo-2-kinase/fructose-2,6-biphosphatase 2/6-phosphofructo-2-kinase/fructose-2,6-biphosphatase 4
MKITLMTSTLKRAIATTEKIATALNIDYLSLKTLDELNVGICDGLTY